MTDWQKSRDTAKEILTKYGITAPPVNVFEIANNEGLQIVYFRPEVESLDYAAVSGLLNNHSGTWEIFLNANDSPKRQAFTLAHELGHYFLQHKGDEYGAYWRDSLYASPKPPQEQEADMFAAELLMPADVLDKFMQDNNLTSHDSTQLAKVFGVSQTAMTFRLNNMGRTEG
jgi:Zn-dependent peptidase ImmA (M78 family)